MQKWLKMLHFAKRRSNKDFIIIYYYIIEMYGTLSVTFLGYTIILYAPYILENSTYVKMPKTFNIPKKLY